MVKMLRSMRVLADRVWGGVGSSSRLEGSAGQTTAEYALVLVISHHYSVLPPVLPG